jgi:hypothetical protein
VSDEPFIAKPKPRKRVNITLGELGDAFGQFLAHTFQTPVTAIGYFADREWGERRTMIEVDLRSQPGIDKHVVVGDVEGKATENQGARMGGDPIILRCRSTHHPDGQDKIVEHRFAIVAVPNEDRTIAFHKVIRWENGDAYYRTHS